MGEVNNINNSPASNPQNVSRTQSKKTDSASDAAFAGSEQNLKEIDLVNDPKFAIKQDNINTDVKYAQDHPESVKRALAFSALAEKDHDAVDSTALMNAYIKEFEQG